MKKLIIGLIIGCFVIMGFSQNQKTENKKTDSVPIGPSIEKVTSEKNDRHKGKQSITRNKKITPKTTRGKLSFSRDVKSSKQKSISRSISAIKPKRILRTDRSQNIAKKSEQIYSNSKSRKRLTRSTGYAERIEIKKMEGYSPVSEEILLRAVGNARPIKANKSK